MIKGRRVGTFTTGILLIILGIVFLLKTFIKNMEVKWIISLWPVILIFLGIEVLTAYVINKEEKIKYDFPGIILIIVMSCFAMFMGSVEIMMKNCS